MKRTNVYTVAMAVILLTAIVGFAGAGQHDEHEQITVRGELMDTACYLAHPDTGQGEDHRKCASMCVKKGVPMSVLDGEGDLYLLLPDHANESVYEQVKEWAADQVEITGRLVNQGGLKGIVVEKSSKL